MARREWWQLSKFEESWRRMTFIEQDVIVGVEGVSTGAWLRAADIVVGEHATRWQARQWISGIHQRYPGCLLAVARQRRGRWCLVGLPARTIVVRGGRFDLTAAEQVGRVIYHLWVVRRHAQL
jgi:hypothetical protein